MKKVRLELTEYLAYDVIMRLLIAILLLLLCFACVLHAFFPDVWWLWSWKPF